ncbi:MAG: ribonuclease III [Elainella sp.]
MPISSNRPNRPNSGRQGLQDLQVELPPFRNRALFEQAMTHRSYTHEHPQALLHNERLEFLGDAVLNFLSGEFLYRQFPSRPEGELTALRAALVDEKQLAVFATWLGLGQHLRLGNGAERDGGRGNPNLLSSAFEAMVGAYFLDADSDVAVVQTYVEPLFAAVAYQLGSTALTINYKSRFQEWALAHCAEVPRYQITAQSGPAHAMSFTAIVTVQGRPYGQGQGRRKQDAEKAAAKAALERLGLAKDEAQDESGADRTGLT